MNTSSPSNDDFAEVIDELLGAMRFIDARLRWEARLRAIVEPVSDRLTNVSIALRMVSRRSWLIIGAGAFAYTCLYGTGAFPA